MGREEFEIDITNDHKWIEIVGKTAYGLACNCIIDVLIIKSEDPVLLGCIELTIKLHLDAMPTKQANILIKY